MILVYTPKITRRIEYIFKHIFINIIGLEVNFTSKVDVFVSFEGPKLSYAPKKLYNEFYIKSNSILLEQGFSDVDIDVKNWEDSKCFFYNENGTIPFDIFAASFYLISRYEEYLPHLKDVYGRFSFQESIAHKNNFIEDPVIDIWAYKLKDSLCSFFPNIIFNDRKFKLKTIIDVPSVYYYKNKGFLRTIGGVFTDLIRFNPKNIYSRFLVIFRLQKDPYDTFNWIINKQKQVTDKFLVLYVQYTKDVFSPSEEKYKHIYNSVLPDTLVWRKSLGNTDILVENYLRHPAYNFYPVVGVNWLQAMRYCSWRTDRVNEQILVDEGVFNVNPDQQDGESFNSEVYLYKNEDYQLQNKKGKKDYNPNSPYGKEGRPVQIRDGILLPKYRLPTEAEWEFAAYADQGARIYDRTTDKNKYSWNGTAMRSGSKDSRGEILANYKRSNGDMMGTSGWLNLSIRVKDD